MNSQESCIRTAEVEFGSIAVNLGYLDGNLLSCSQEFAGCRPLQTRCYVPETSDSRHVLSNAQILDDC